MADPLTIRNNNPGAIEFGPFAQRYGAGTDGRFAVFPDMDTGYRAMEGLLDTYERKHGLNTVRGIVERWAPRKADNNSTDGYIAKVAQGVGVHPDEPLTAQHRPALVRAMAGYEAGRPMPGPSGGSPSPASIPSPSGRPPMADYSYDTSGMSPEEVADKRRRARDLFGMVGEYKGGGLLGALAQTLAGYESGRVGREAEAGERAGRGASMRALTDALTGKNPQAALAAGLATPYGAQVLGPIAGHVLQSNIQEQSPAAQAALRTAQAEAGIKERELATPPFQGGVLKDGEVPYMRDPRTGQYNFFQPPGFQPPAEKARMTERVKKEEDARAKALEFSTEADEMARVIRSAKDVMVGDAIDGQKHYGAAPEKLFGKGKVYKVHPEIFGPYEASTINEKLTAGLPSVAGAIDFVRGGRDLSPEERQRQRGVIASRLQDIMATLTSAQNKGQGAVSNFEREMYQKAGAALNDGDINKAVSILDDLEKRFVQKAVAARTPYLSDTRPSLVPPPGAASPASVGGASAMPGAPIVSTPAIRGGGAQPQSSSPINLPGTVVAPPTPSAAPAAPESAAPSQTQQVDFGRLTKDQQRTAIMRMAKNFDNPQAHRDFVAQFGPEAYVTAKAMAEKLRKGMAF